MGSFAPCVYIGHYLYCTGSNFLSVPYIKRRRTIANLLMSQNPEGVNFIGLNIILIGVVALAIFAYLVMLIRKRWKKGFLHDSQVRPKGKK